MKLTHKFAVSILSAIAVINISLAVLVSTHNANANHRIYPSQILSTSYIDSNINVN